VLLKRGTRVVISEAAENLPHFRSIQAPPMPITRNVHHSVCNPQWPWQGLRGSWLRCWKSEEPREGLENVFIDLRRLIFTNDEQRRFYEWYVDRNLITNIKTRSPDFYCAKLSVRHNQISSIKFYFPVYYLRSAIVSSQQSVSWLLLSIRLITKSTQSDVQSLRVQPRLEGRRVIFASNRTLIGLAIYKGDSVKRWHVFW